MGGKTDSQGGKDLQGHPVAKQGLEEPTCAAPVPRVPGGSQPAPAPVAITGRASIQPWGPGPWPGYMDLLAWIHPTMQGPGEVAC